MRTRAERRKNDYKKAVRKKNISECCGLKNLICYDNIHQYSKNKIHNSCPACSRKTNNRGRYGERRVYLRADNARINSMRCEIDEYRIM